MSVYFESKSVTVNCVRFRKLSGSNVLVFVFINKLSNRLFNMTCSDNKQSSKSKRKMQDMSKANTDLNKSQRWDQVPWRIKHPLLTGYIPVCSLSQSNKNGKTRRQLGISYGLTINMKNVSQHATKQRIVFADNVAVSTVELTKL